MAFPELTNIGVFLVAAVMLAIAPGPGMLYVMARTVAGGRATGLASAFGTGCGGLVHVVAASVGLSAVLASSAEAFLLVKYLGAAYLVFLGVRTMMTRRMPSTRQAGGPVGTRNAFLQGVLTEALNVKTALFFLALIPQFVVHPYAAAPQFLVLGAICIALNTTADIVVVISASRLLPWLGTTSRSTGLLTRGSGAVLIGLGVFVALADARR